MLNKYRKTNPKQNKQQQEQQQNKKEKEKRKRKKQTKPPPKKPKEYTISELYCGRCVQLECLNSSADYSAKNDSVPNNT